MAEHYTANTESVTAWCNKCNHNTQHSVSGNRRGRCLEHEAPRFSKKQLENQKRIEVRQGEGLGRNIKTQLAKAPQCLELAACGDPLCAGCYDCGEGVRIHPPRSNY
jgi:hypothetical protein